MSGKIRVGLVGVRRSSGRPGYRYEVVGVTSLTPSSREQFASQRGIRAFCSLKEMLDSVGVADNCAPGYAQEPICITALEAGKQVIVEKPFTGYYGPAGDESFRGDCYPKEEMFDEALESSRRIISAWQKSGKKVCYAKNWVYAPAVQKEAEILSKSKGQILWAVGCQTHFDSTSPAYGIWRFSGGGSVVGKSCHSLSAILYLKAGGRTHPLRKAGEAEKRQRQDPPDNKELRLPGPWIREDRLPRRRGLVPASCSLRGWHGSRCVRIRDSDGWCLQLSRDLRK